ncbi:hypothetical protein ACD591_02490 [Rufibacter glacialis]|uniref:Uncharacterized protein n=1 Tax=Rufibacter glacialis TaxID=1259555 RepID=A0ABV4RAP4_9BACT|nr:hypothetical protein [Rufibacter glacialis]
MDLEKFWGMAVSPLFSGKQAKKQAAIDNQQLKRQAEFSGDRLFPKFTA